jgi:hypothetical protein
MARRQCPPLAELVRFVDADLSPESSGNVREHLGHCERCNLSVTELEALVKDLGATRAIELDVSAHVKEVMRRLDRSAPTRSRAVARIVAVTALAASVALLIGVVGLRHGAPSGTFLDGQVSYVELAGFVETATADVRNSNMRPHIFARGPFARDDAAILDLRGPSDVRRFRLSDAGPLRLRLRDKEGLPLLDAHAEAGTRLELALPERWAKGAMVERATCHSG